MRERSLLHFVVIRIACVTTLCLSFVGYAQNPLKITVPRVGALEETILATTQQPVTALQIKGEINGKDIAYLRTLSGGSFDLYQQTEQSGTLTYLDLKEATFVRDLEKYNFLDDAYPNPDRIGKSMFARCLSLQTIVLPKTVTLIDESAFQGSTALREVRNTQNITVVEWAAFQNCTALSNISFGKSLIRIRGFAFSGCTALTSFNIPTSTKDIGSNSFEKSGLRYIILHAEADNLGNQIFKDCKQLKYVRMESSMAMLPTGTFHGCTALEEVYLADGTNVIPQDHFADCVSLRSIELSESFTYLQGYSFWNCPKLQRIILHSTNPVMATDAFSKACIPQLTVYAPREVLATYQSQEPWKQMTLRALEDSPLEEKVLLEDDFDSYTPDMKEWEGNDKWMPVRGTYIRQDGDNQVLRLGDNEDFGVVKTKLLDLSANRGSFRIRLMADGWNDLHSSFLVELLDKEERVLSEKYLTIPKPNMGQDLRTYDFEMIGGLKECRLRISTSEKARIAILDEIKVYQTAQPQPAYRVDTEAVDFGRVAQNSDVADRIIRFSGENLTHAPKVRVIPSTAKAFVVDSEYDNGTGTITLMLNTDKVGTFSGYIQVDYDKVNVLYIPLRATVEDPNNPLNLDTTEPITELDEDFNAEARIPKGWSNIALEGTRTWVMRTTGVQGNRYPAIDAREQTIGKAHALLVLPAINFDSPEVQKSKLAFDLATVKADGAELHLVHITPQGKITTLQNLSENSDHEWKNLSFKLADFNLHGIQFLAFEYLGEADKKMTIYRLDNVKIAEKLVGIERTPSPSSLQIAVSEETITIQGLSTDSLIRLYTLEGVLLGQCRATGETQTLCTQGAGVYLLQIDAESYKVVVPAR